MKYVVWDLVCPILVYIGGICLPACHLHFLIYFKMNFEGSFVASRFYQCCAIMCLTLFSKWNTLLQFFIKASEKMRQQYLRIQTMLVWFLWRLSYIHIILQIRLVYDIYYILQTVMQYVIYDRLLQEIC